MILSAQTILERILHHSLIIKPFYERTVEHGMSYGLSAAGYDMRIKDGYALLPGAFQLATTVEYFEFPNDLRGILYNKSSWARKGLSIQNTVFEPGWRGWPTIELSNNGPDTIRIAAGAPIGQMSFELLDRPTSQPYSGKYQDQPQRPVEAKDEKA